VAACAGLYLAAVVAVWLVVASAAERWWPATVLLFAPRMLLAVPLVVLVPAALWTRSRVAVAAALAAGVLVAGPVMGFNIPWSRLGPDTVSGQRLRVLTLNMHYGQNDPRGFEALMKSSGPHVVAVQEWQGAEKSLLEAAPGWHVHATPRLFLASRHPIRSATELGDDSMGAHASAAHYELETPSGLVHLFSLHTATTREGISDILHKCRNGPSELQENSDRRREQMEFGAGRAAACPGPVVVLGDFNTPPQSPFFGRVWRGYSNAFSAAGWGWGYTFCGARTMVRIDHILLGPDWRCTGCQVGPAVGSPHRPVIADLVWLGSPSAGE
jgi:endonuclease/exonuclease/phosphatase (EEP) superfamily protein YafD